jgi:2-oxoglutarate dehydrogenase E1 component
MKAMSRRSRSRSCTRRSAQHPTTLTLYAEKLVKEGVVTEADLEAMKAAYRADLDKEFEIGQAYKPNKADWLDGKWAGLTGQGR